MSEFDFIRMGATGRQLQDIMTSRLAEREAEITGPEMEAIMLVCVELAAMAHGAGEMRRQWASLEFLAGKMRKGARE